MLLKHVYQIVSSEFAFRFVASLNCSNQPKLRAPDGWKQMQVHPLDAGAHTSSRRFCCGKHAATSNAAVAALVLYRRRNAVLQPSGVQRGSWVFCWLAVCRTSAISGAPMHGLNVSCTQSCCARLRHTMSRSGRMIASSTRRCVSGPGGGTARQRRQ